MASLTREALQMIHVVASSHHHLEGGDSLAADGTEAFCSEQPESDKYINNK